jgi:hypothetical protein
MPATTKVIATAGITTAVLAGLWFAAKTDPPIIIGDGSVFMSHDSIATNSPTQEEAFKHLHKVRTIKVIDVSGAISQTVPVKDRQWGLTSVNNRVRFDFDWRDLGLAVGLVGTCVSPWQGSGTYYTCGDDRLTPATLTFTDGQNCPLTGSTTPTCTLTCPSGYCRLELEYK